MVKRTGLWAMLILAALLFWSAPVWAQQTAPDVETLKKTAPKIFIDCSSCDIEYFKTEITFVNYVRDRNEAQVHILITHQRTGSGGYEYTLSFSGQHEFQGLDDVLRYYSNTSDTEDEVRRGLVNILKMGLMRYVVRTPIGRRIAVSAAEPEKPEAGPDKWKLWVFNLSAQGYFSGQQSYSHGSWSTNMSASKTTPDFKVRLALTSNYQHDSYSYLDENIMSHQESYYLDVLAVKGLGEHWSVGAFFEMANDSYRNVRLDIVPAPAIEYDLFPYSQSTRRQLRFLYRLNFHSVRYQDMTIYDKTQENLLQGDLSVTLDVKEKWGSITTSIEGAHYFHDFSKYHLNIYGSVQLNLFKGLNAQVFGGGGWIKDQLGLFKGDATLEDVLLQRRELATTYNYFVGLSLGYTFGSIYTNVINPRFGSTGGGGMSFTMN